MNASQQSMQANGGFDLYSVYARLNVGVAGISTILLLCLVSFYFGYSLSRPLLPKTKKRQETNDNLVRRVSIVDRKVPNHVAVIMDGNRRFGIETHGDALKGHWAGGQTLIDFVQWSMQEGVKVLTVYAFSTENWSRDPVEVTTLMTIFAKYAETFRTEALAKNVRVNVLSTDYEKLPSKVKASIDTLQNETKHCAAFVLNICLSYGGRSEILQATKTIAEKVQAGVIDPNKDIDEGLFSQCLCTSEYKDPDILIRTSGEQRISNFLLWQLAYTEIFFSPKFWPQFTKEDFYAVMDEYSLRCRRFGV